MLSATLVQSSSGTTAARRYRFSIKISLEVMFAQKRCSGLLWLGLLVAVAATSAQAEIEYSLLDKLAAYNDEELIYNVNMDDMIDNNIKSIREALADQDPADLSDIQLQLSSHINMNLHNGWMQNLSLLKRAGHSVLSYGNKLIRADITLGWDELSFDFRYLLKVLFITRNGDLHGQLSQVKLNVVVDVDLESYQVILKRLNFTNIGQVNIKLEGHLMDKIYNLIINALSGLFKKLIHETVENKAVSMIQEKIDEINKEIGKHHTRSQMFTFVNLVDEIYVPEIVYKR